MKTKVTRPTNCAICGCTLPVAPTGRVRYYCSQRCARIATPPRSRARADRPTACLTCSGPVEQARTGGVRRYCSKQCQPGRSAQVVRAAKLRTIYGLSEPDYLAMLTRQVGRCAICSATPDPTAPPSVNVLHVDHDHATGAVRGLLCGRCNKALGLFDDNPASLAAAIDYLTTSKEPTCLASAS